MTDRDTITQTRARTPDNPDPSEDPWGGGLITLQGAPVMHVYGGIDQIAAQRPQPRQGVIFVGASELAVSDHVRGQTRRELPS